MRAIVTKYAFSKGPYLVSGRMGDNLESKGMLIVDCCSRSEYYHAMDVAQTKVAALCRVREMAAKQRNSLSRRLDKLDGAETRAIRAIENMDL